MPINSQCIPKDLLSITLTVGLHAGLPVCAIPADGYLYLPTDCCIDAEHIK